MLTVLDSKPVFPPVEQALEDGLLALGGDLSQERLLLAYRSGIFPWYEGNHILWWSPDPRFVLFPDELYISRTTRKQLRKNQFHISINKAFRQVITSCQQVKRKDQDGTWITPAMLDAYCELHESGYAHSVEAWQDNALVGGMYGIRIGNVFCGESMFSLVPNASKFAFITYIEQLQQEGVKLIDCQVYSEHLESLGARMIPRKEFLKFLNDASKD